VNNALLTATSGISGAIGQTGDGATPAAGTFTALAANALTVGGDLQHNGSKVGFFNTTAVAKQPALSADSSGQGKIDVCTNSATTCATSSVANGNTVDEVNALQQRVKDLEKALQKYGLLN
jgi:hypothetical protein